MVDVLVHEGKPVAELVSSGDLFASPRYRLVVRADDGSSVTLRTYRGTWVERRMGDSFVAQARHPLELDRGRYIVAREGVLRGPGESVDEACYELFDLVLDNDPFELPRVGKDAEGRGYVDVRSGKGLPLALLEERVIMLGDESFLRWMRIPSAYHTEVCLEAPPAADAYCLGAFDRTREGFARRVEYLRLA